jgi:hypothetical protein
VRLSLVLPGFLAVLPSGRAKSRGATSRAKGAKSSSDRVLVNFAQQVRFAIFVPKRHFRTRRRHGPKCWLRRRLSALGQGQLRRAQVSALGSNLEKLNSPLWTTLNVRRQAPHGRHFKLARPVAKRLVKTSAARFVLLRQIQHLETLGSSYHFALPRVFFETFQESFDGVLR